MIKNSDLIKNKGEKYGIDDLLAIMERLRQPDGCPWDREQDHHSIRNDFIEETYEAAEAIFIARSKGNSRALILPMCATEFAKSLSNAIPMFSGAYRWKTPMRCLKIGI